MKALLLISSLFSVSALAHFELGIYKGVAQDNTECFILFKSKTYTTTFKNPLSERVVVHALSKRFTLQHPVKIDESLTSVSYEHVLETAIPFEGGAEFFRVNMGEEGPTSFIHLENNWKTKEQTKLVCEKLVYIGQ